MMYVYYFVAVLVLIISQIALSSGIATGDDWFHKTIALLILCAMIGAFIPVLWEWVRPLQSARGTVQGWTHGWFQGRAIPALIMGFLIWMVLKVLWALIAA